MVDIVCFVCSGCSSFLFEFWLIVLVFVIGLFSELVILKDDDLFFLV